MTRKSLVGMKMHKYHGPRGNEITRPRKRAGKTILTDLVFICLIALGIFMILGGVFQPVIGH